MKVEYNGKTYEMTEEQVYAAYLHQQRMFYTEDCCRHLSDYFDDETAPEKYSAMIDEIIDRYDNEYDCNIAENTQWDLAIEYVLGM